MILMDAARTRARTKSRTTAESLAPGMNGKATEAAGGLDDFADGEDCDTPLLRIAGSPDRRIAGSPDRRIAGSPDRRPRDGHGHVRMAAPPPAFDLPA